MNILVLRNSPELKLTSALDIFEREFTYPLGSDRRFRIAHGGDGSAGNAWDFFRALGDAAVYVVAEQQDRVIGTIGAALRPLVRPDGTAAVGLYIGDLKIVENHRSGLVLYRLFQALKTWTVTHAPLADSLAYSIVMEGTAVTPAGYSGRLGFPPFTPLGSSTILWLHTACEPAKHPSALPVSAQLGQSAFSTFAQGYYHVSDPVPNELAGGPANLRSQLTPAWLISTDSKACGRLEDTLLAKRLWTTAGDEMRSAHLSHFAFSDIHSGIALVNAALGHAATAGYPMLFVAVPSTTTDIWRQWFSTRLRSVATAHIFGTANTLPPGPWLINTADI